ncbi:efflux RND transporter permease subunit [bacterium]|nr:efflux RND transporter permease subunit [bacterium]
MNLVKGALENPHVVFVIALATAILGGTALTKMPTDILPVFKTPAVQVITFYPGMPAEVVERDMTSRIERWTGQSNGIERQESKSMIGVSIVKDFFRSDIDPNTAMSQVTSLAMSDLFYLPPGTIPPMVMPFDPTASIPLCLISVSSDEYDETTLYDVAYFDLRQRLQGISGVIAPAVYGGKLRRILAYVDREKLEARGLSPLDVVRSINRDNLMIPTGNMKIGKLDYQVDSNAMVSDVRDLGGFVVKEGRDGRPVYLRDVADPEDSAQIQTNIVRVTDKATIDSYEKGSKTPGKRQVYIPIYRQPGANTIAVVEGIKASMNGIIARLPKGVRLDVVLDQSIFVREAIGSLEFEAGVGALLAGVMILIFLGSFRSTGVILLSIPLSIMAAFLGMYATGDSINAMTLGGLALAVGRLVDDSIVVLENIDRHLRTGKPPREAALDAAAEVALPVLSATITTIVVFLPVVFIFGIGKFLFGPLALAVTFSMAASYFVSMTVVPVACALLFKAHTGPIDPSTSLRTGVSATEERSLHPTWLERTYRPGVAWAVKHRRITIAVAAALFAGAVALVPSLGQELFPQADAGAFTVRVRGGTGTRVEQTEELVKRIDQSIVETISKDDLQMVISNIGVLLDWPAAYTPNSGPQDAFIAIQLTEHRAHTAQHWASVLRGSLRSKFPGTEIFFETGGLMTAALNFGLPSPINVQVQGNDLDKAHEILEAVKERVEKVRGAEDVRIQQRLDYPQLQLVVDRARASSVGLSDEDIVKNTVTALNSSINFAPSFWIDESNGNHYFMGAQYKEEAIKDLDTLLDIPITSARQKHPVRVRNVATINRTTAPSEVNHLALSRVSDLYANVRGRDVGSVAREVEAVVSEVKKDPKVVPPGYFVETRGEVQSMRESFKSLGWGAMLAAVLIYLVLVAQFRNFRDPLVIMASVPLGLIGVVAILFVTGTTLNVQSLLGIVFELGISVSNAVLIVDLTRKLRARGMSIDEAVVEASTIRVRPILMTSLAAALGLLPMALGFGRGSEANEPLARAVIGGIIASTLLGRQVVPALYRALAKPVLSSVEGKGAPRA